MKRMKRLTATMILAAVATLGTPQANAGIMLGDVATRGTREKTGIMLGDFARVVVLQLGGIMLGD
jgi:hypothetical protein